MENSISWSTETAQEIIWSLEFIFVMVNASNIEMTCDFDRLVNYKWKITEDRARELQSKDKEKTCYKLCNIAHDKEI